MQPLSLLFFSSSPISVPLLRSLLKDARFEVRGLFCQPDKPAGRGQALTAPETKAIAEAEGIAIYQAPKLSAEKELLETLRKNPPDFLLTFAYGQILSEDWLALPRLAPLNVHASLLPHYRGAAPIQAALLAGESKTGLSLMKMEKGMDTGPVAFQHELSIEEEMTSEELFDALGDLAAEVVPDDLLALRDNLDFKAQDESLATYTSKIKKEDGLVDFQKDAKTLLRAYRAYTPWPGLWTTHQGARVKLLELSLAEGADLKPGELCYRNFSFFLGTAHGNLELKRLQLEGKKALEPREFILGCPDWASAFLGT